MLPPKVSDCQKNCSELYHSVMNLDRSNKFDLAMLLWASKFATAKIELTFEMGKKTPLVG